MKLKLETDLYDLVDDLLKCYDIEEFNKLYQRTMKKLKQVRYDRLCELKGVKNYEQYI